jgi:hypothetical protein
MRVASTGPVILPDLDRFANETRFACRHGSSDFIGLRFSFKEVSMPRLTGSTSHPRWVATLIAFLVASLVLIGFVAPSVASAGGLKEIYGYSCCAGGFGTVNYHPGETVDVEWISTALRKSDASPVTLDLSVSASGPFSTIAAVKKAFARSHPELGRTNFSATTLHVSDEKKGSPDSVLHVPANAGKGYYEITTKRVKGQNSSGGSLIVSILPAKS